MWDWLTGNIRRRARRRTNRDTLITDSELPNDTQAAEVPRFLQNTRESNHLFFIPSAPLLNPAPKCLRRLPCSQILYGARVEDYSSECWLEDHLHQFGSPENQQTAPPPFVSTSVFNLEDSDDSITAGNESSEYFDFLNDETSADIISTDEQFVLPENGSTDVDSDCNFVDINIVNPPPYSEFDLPPSYEEAVGISDIRSTSSRSTSSSLAFMW